MSAKEDYQVLSERLETVLAKLQAPDVRVDEAVALYEEGLKLVTELEKHLATAQNKIEKLKLQSKG